MLKKEIEILKRKCKKRIITNHFDRLFFTILNKVANIKDCISIVKPETVLKWQRMIIKRFWTSPGWCNVDKQVHDFKE